jgi:uncharacterized protein (TIGR00255 family)
MTAFGRDRQSVCGKDVTVEIKSVNNRYFDCSVKLPRAYSYLEEKIKPYLQSRGISRGKVDVYISVDVVDTEEVNVTLDRGHAAGYIAALKQLRDEFGLPDDISVMNVAKKGDLFKITKPEGDAEHDWQMISSVLSVAADNFLTARKNEGARLEADIAAKLKNIRSLTEKIGELSSGDIGNYRDKLEARIREVLADNTITVDESRLLTECAIFADKIAIDEELTRLGSHFTTFEEIVKSNEPSGRKLDFLMQEMNREVNTVGSKCSNASIAKLVVECKCELEKIREQIQNIE